MGVKWHLNMDGYALHAFNTCQILMIWECMRMVGKAWDVEEHCEMSKGWLVFLITALMPPRRNVDLPRLISICKVFANLDSCL